MVDVVIKFFVQYTDPETSQPYATLRGNGLHYITKWVPRAARACVRVRVRACVQAVTAL